ncbi:hypothetical protein BLOT_015341 [Blomia tropicalis]|nr:hypothetical protein BLOT_015341 [Blomia tropicalis]
MYRIFPTNQKKSENQLKNLSSRFHILLLNVGSLKLEPELCNTPRRTFTTTNSINSNNQC